MKTFKSIVSVTLAIIMVIGLFGGVPVDAGATTYSYVKVDSEPDDWSGDYLIVCVPS